MSRGLLLAVFVGGASSRMKGFPKGLLKPPRGSSGDDAPTLVEKLVAAFREVLPSGRAVLVGKSGAYSSLDLQRIKDEPAGIGPLGGLAAVLRLGLLEKHRVVVAGCDMAFVDASLFRTLLREARDEPAIAARRGGRWEPLFSRLDPEVVLPVLERQLEREEYSLCALLDAANCKALPLSSKELEQLDDWDTPEDVERGHREFTR